MIWLALAILAAASVMTGWCWRMTWQDKAREKRIKALLKECEAAVRGNGLATAQMVELLTLRDARKTVLAMDEAQFAKHARELLAAVPTVEDWEEPDGAGSQPGSAAH